MTTTVDAPTSVVNDWIGDYGSQPVQCADVKTLAERMRWVLENKLVDGKPLNASRWSLLAHLTRQQVQTFLTRADSKPGADLELQTVRALATAAGVSLEWLATGAGTPDAPPADDVNAPTVLADAIRFARANKLPENVITEYARTHSHDGFAGALPEDLYTEMKAIAQQRKRGAVEPDASAEIEAEERARRAEKQAAKDARKKGAK